MPMVGMVSRSVTALATSSGTSSRDDAERAGLLEG